MEYLTLNNGIKMPKLGYGVYQTPAEDTRRCVLDANSPVDWDAIDASVRKTKRVFVFEETSDRECLADEIFAHLIETGIPAVCRKRNLGRGFIPHGAPAALLAAAGLDACSLTKLMQEELS